MDAVEEVEAESDAPGAKKRAQSFECGTSQLQKDANQPRRLAAKRQRWRGRRGTHLGASLMRLRLWNLVARLIRVTSSTLAPAGTFGGAPEYDTLSMSG